MVDIEWHSACGNRWGGVFVTFTCGWFRWVVTEGREGIKRRSGDTESFGRETGVGEKKSTLDGNCFSLKKHQSDELGLLPWTMR